MRRRAVVPALLSMLALALALPGVAGARAPERITIDVTETFDLPDVSAVCGFDVTSTFTGVAHVSLTRNADGLVVRERDTSPHAVVTYSSPDTGASFSFPGNMTSTWDYGDGAVIGSTVITRFHGLFGHVPGVLSSDAGLTIVEGVVVGFDEFGIPEVEFGPDALAEHGARHDFEEISAAICEKLAP